MFHRRILSKNWRCKYPRILTVYLTWISAEPGIIHFYIYIYKIFFSGKRAHRSRRLTKSGVRVSFCRPPWRACQGAVLVSYPLEAVSGAYLGDQWGAAAWFTLAATTRASGFLIKASHIWDSTLFRCELERSSAGLKKKKERKNRNLGVWDLILVVS